MSDTCDRFAALACVGSLIVALLLVFEHQVPAFGVETDFVAEYAHQAQRLLAGQSYTYEHNPPGYPILLAAAGFLTEGNLFLAGKILSALAVASFGWVAYLTLRELFTAPVALAAVLCTLAFLVPYSFLAAADAIGALLIAASLYFFFRRPQPSLVDAGVAGIVAGLAYLVRAQAVFLVPGFVLALLLAAPGPRQIRARAVAAAWLVGGFLVIAVPWFVVNSRIHGSATASTAYLQIAAHFYAPTGDTYGHTLTDEASTFHSLADVVRTNPGRVLHMYVRDVLLRNPARIALDLLGFPAYLFAGAGLLWSVVGGSGARTRYLLVCALGYLLLGLVGFYDRYYLFLLPPLFAAVAYAALYRGVEPAVHPAVGWAICLGIMFTIGSAAYDKSMWVIQHEPRGLVGLARALRSQAGPQDGVLACSSHVAFLAGLPEGPGIAPTPEEYVAMARETGGRYIVYHAHWAETCPTLNFLRDPATVPPPFRLILRDDASGTLVYEIAR